MDRLVAGGPWFRRHPQYAAIVTAVLFAIVTTLRLLTTNESDATGLLYALPVALAAMAFGRVVGTTSALCAAGLLWGWAAGHPEVSLSPLGWTSRIVPLVLLGVLVGSAADAVEEATQTRLALAVAEARRRDAAEVNDEILQRLTVAKWRAEAGASEDAAALLDEAMVQAQQLVSSLLEDVELDDRLRVHSSTGDASP
jgi:signal transduction histidine kinase